MTRDTSTSPPQAPTLKPPDARRWQFSLSWLMMVMTFVAVAVGILRLLNVVIFSDFLTMVLAAYVVISIGYTLLRWSFIMWPQIQAIRRNREALAQWAEQQRQHARDNAQQEQESRRKSP